jgi:hypothetical protein
MKGTECQELLVSDSNECGSGDTVGLKLVEGKGLQEGCDSKDLWKSVENQMPALESVIVYTLR